MKIRKCETRQKGSALEIRWTLVEPGTPPASRLGLSIYVGIIRLIGGMMLVAGLVLIASGILGFPLDPETEAKAATPPLERIAARLVMGIPLAVLGALVAGYRTRIRVQECDKSLRISKGVFCLQRTRTFSIEGVQEVVLLHKPDVWGPILQLHVANQVPVDLAHFKDAQRTQLIAESLAASLKLPLVDCDWKLAGDMVLEEKRRELIAGSIVGAVIVGSLVALTVYPVYLTATDCLHAWRYQPELLVEVPCVIESMIVHKQKRSSENSSDGATIGFGDSVDVSYRYEFNGTPYVGTKYSPIGSNVDSDFTAWPPGHQTVCYLNPKWPDMAVLVEASDSHSIVFMAAIVFAWAFFGLCYVMICRDKWKAYEAAAQSVKQGAPRVRAHSEKPVR